MASASLPATPTGASAWDATHDHDALLTELLDDATNETDALLAELLADEQRSQCSLSGAWSVPKTTEMLQLLQSPLSPTSSSEEDNRPQTIPPWLTTQRASNNNEPIMDKRTQTLAEARDQVSRLTSELKRLRSGSSAANDPFTRTAKELAIHERLKRRRAEDECRQLRNAVYAQTQFLRGLRSVFTMSMPLSPLDVAHYLHNYTRLPRDRSTRWNEYAALAQETRLEAAMDLLCRETREMRVEDEREQIVPSLDAPFLWSELLRHHDGFSMTSINVYALETDDLGAVLRGACVAVREIPARDPAYECVSRKKQLVDPDAALPATANGSNIIYRVLGIDHRNNDDELTVESHNITLFKQTDDHALLLEDFIDHDELHPHDATADITRQVVGACLIRRERCHDGEEHTVVRTLRTRRYRFHEHTPPAILQRFQQLISATMEPNDLLFRQFIVDTVNHEEQAYARAQQLLSACEA